MCDTLCAIGPGDTLFAKNSDRPSSEVQLVESHPARPPGGTVRTTHIEIPDAGAYAVLGSRPEWMWGFEHGVNERGVAIGNEKVYTRANPNKEPLALTGMDLVRLGLERGGTADEALEVMTALLEQHGQGGVCDQATGESYFSSFLIADRRGAWVLETSGRTWVAAPVTDRRALSNRLTIRTEWTRASADVPAGADWDDWRHPDSPTGHADVRLAASDACLAAEVTPETLARHLRDHGGEVMPHGDRWPSGDGVTVCMHLRGYQNTTSSIIAELGEETRVWAALGQPCVSVYVPATICGAPSELGQAETWQAFAALRDRVEADDGALAEIRSVLDPAERELWAAVPGDDAWPRVADTLARVQAMNGGRPS